MGPRCLASLLSAQTALCFTGTHTFLNNQQLAANTPLQYNHMTSRSTLAESSATQLLSSTEPCDVCEETEKTPSLPSLVNQKGAGSLLRNAVLTNVDGESVSLDGAMGKGASVVIFLRHMG